MTSVPLETKVGIKNIECWVIDKIVTDIDTRDWKEAKQIWPDIPLPQIDNLNGDYRVDLLIGADAMPLIECCKSMKRNGLKVDKTILGWIIYGTLPKEGRTRR